MDQMPQEVQMRKDASVWENKNNLFSYLVFTYKNIINELMKNDELLFQSYLLGGENFCGWSEDGRS